MDDVLHPNLREEIGKLGSLLKDIRIGMMTTLDENGRMHSRPMMTSVEGFEGRLWFFCSASSHKIADITWNRQVHLVYSSPEKEEFISVSGTGEIVRDAKKAKELWKPIYQTWFPKGLSDPDLVLLKVEVDQAEYWEEAKDQPTQLMGGIKSKTEEHKRIDLAG